MPKRKEFAVNMLQRIFEDEAFLKLVCFSDEATFHVKGYRVSNKSTGHD